MPFTIAHFVTARPIAAQFVPFLCRSLPASRHAGRMSQASRPRRRAAVGLAALLLLLGACGRGVPEQRVASGGTEQGEATEGPPPVEATTSTTAVDVTTTSVPEPTTTSSTASAPSSTTSTTRARAGDACGNPAVTDFPLSAAGGKPAELAVAADGAIWFTDNGTAAVGRLAPDGTVTMFPVSAGRDPASIAVGPAGDVWFTQYAFSKPEVPPSPEGPAPPPDPSGPPAIGRISGDGTVTEFPLPTIDGNRGGDPLSGALPRGIAAGPDGAMWFTESGADQIGRIGPDGTITEYPLPSRNTDHAFPDGIIPGLDGALWFHETLAGRLGRIDPVTKTITERPIERPSSSPMEWGGGGPLVRGPDGGFWFADWTTTIARVTTAGKMTSFRVAPPADAIRSMVAGPDGRLWFADQRSAALFRMTTKGAVTLLWPLPGAPKAYESVGGMAVAPDGSVWVAQPWANKITRLSCRG